MLSVPSLDMFGGALKTAQSAADEFINMSKAGNVEKIVIDLQQNTGGEALLAFDLFKRFFPNIDPYGASRMRAHHAADVMGSYLTAYYAGLSTQDPDYEVLAADEWITPGPNSMVLMNTTEIVSQPASAIISPAKSSRRAQLENSMGASVFTTHPLKQCLHMLPRTSSWSVAPSLIYQYPNNQIDFQCYS